MAVEAAAAKASGVVTTPYPRSSSTILRSSPAVLRSSFLSQGSWGRGHRSVLKSSGYCKRKDQRWRVTAVAGAEGLAEYLVKGAVQVATEGGPGWGGASMLIPVLLWYATASPGSVSGLLDFLGAPLHAKMQPTFAAEEVELGRQLGEGSFGLVFEGYLRRKGAKRDEKLHVVLKRAKSNVDGALEVHAAEVHMNHRVKRTAPGACADFLGTVEVSPSQAKGRLTEGLWLLWRFQGDRTLDQCMKHKSFPENIAEAVLGAKAVSRRGFSQEENLEFESAVVKRVMCQILGNLRELHSAGVVHRDVKPLNLVLDQKAGAFTLIDLGACVDLRTGYNYVPRETIIDPTYAAPEQYVMPTCTPVLPPDPLCSLISPLVWLLNSPDRFDLYSTGIVLMQLAVKPLRHDQGIMTFNRDLERAKYDLDLWRKRCHIPHSEFAILDANDGAGWDLVRSLLQARHDKAHVVWPSLGNGRPSAAAALAHRFLRDSAHPFPMPKVPADVLGNLERWFPDAKPDLGGAVLAADAAAPPSAKSGEKSNNKRGLGDLLGGAALAANSLSRRPSDSVGKSSTPGAPTGKHGDVVAGAAMAADRRTRGQPLATPPQPSSRPTGGLVAQAAFAAAAMPERAMKGAERLSKQLTGLASKQREAPEVVVAQATSTVAATPPERARRGAEAFSRQVAALASKHKGASDTVVPQAAFAAAEMPERATHRAAATLSKQLADLAASRKEVSNTVTSMRGPLESAAKASLPSAAALAAGWAAWIGLRASSEMTYEFGHHAADSMGLSATAFLAFFLIAKPWLTVVADGERTESSRRRQADEATAAAASAENSMAMREILTRREEQSAAFKGLGLEDAVEAMYKQMASLEACLASEREYSQQQSEVLSRLQGLLL